MDKEKSRNKYLIKKYGITSNEFNLLMVVQKGVCAICGNPPKNRALHVDHNHRLKTKNKKETIRGLLCHRCNRALIFFSDSPIKLRSAANYLERKTPWQ